MKQFDNWSKDGILLGISSKGEHYFVDGYQHILMLSPVGSGKGVSFILPNLLNHEDSAVVHDIGLENYHITSGWRRKQGQKIYIFDPLQTQGFTHCYNPLDTVRTNPDVIVEDVQKLTHILVHTSTSDLIPVYASARILLVGLILYVLASDKKTKSLGEVVRILMDDFVTKLSSILQETEGKIHPSCLQLLKGFLAKTDKVQSKNISVLMACLEPWTNPLIDYATSKTDFDIRDFRKNKSTLYVNVTPPDTPRLQPLIQFFYQHLLDCLMEPEQRSPGKQIGVTFILDEFPTIGKMEKLPFYVAYCRGYHIRLALIAQDIEQIESAYGVDIADRILACTTFKIVFAPNNIETAQIISALCVDKDVEEPTIGWNEIFALPRDEQLLLFEGYKPMKAKKIRYYEDEKFRSRVLEPVKIKK